MSSIESVRKSIQPWVSQYGEVRYYVNNWYDLIGDVVQSYANNEWMSPDLKKIKRCKVWFDQQAKIHVDGIKDEMIIEIIRSNLEDRFFLRSPLSSKVSWMGPIYKEWKNLGFLNPKKWVSTLFTTHNPYGNHDYSHHERQGMVKE